MAAPRRRSAPEQRRMRVTRSAVLLRALLALAGLAAVVAATAVAVRSRGTAVPGGAALPSPAPRASRPTGDVVMLGWARPISGGRGKHGPGHYVHEIDLEDGRKVRYR